MPETLAALPSPAQAEITLQPKQRVWAALRELLTEPDTEAVRRIRSMLGHIYPTPPERMRALSGLFAATQAAFQTVAAGCGWCPTMEHSCGVSWDLALMAAVFYDAEPEDGR